MAFGGGPYGRRTRESKRGKKTKRKSGVDSYFLCASSFNVEIQIFFFFYLKNYFLKMAFGVVTYFSFFLRKNKIRNKNPNATSYLEKICLQNEFKFGGHVTYLEGTIVSRSTLLSP